MPGDQSLAVCVLSFSLAMYKLDLVKENEFCKTFSMIIIVCPQNNIVHLLAAEYVQPNQVLFSLSTVSTSRFRVTDTSVSSVPAFVVVRMMPSSFKKQKYKNEKQKKLHVYKNTVLIFVEINIFVVFLSQMKFDQEGNVMTFGKGQKTNQILYSLKVQLMQGEKRVFA